MRRTASTDSSLRSASPSWVSCRAWRSARTCTPNRLADVQAHGLSHAGVVRQMVRVRTIHCSWRRISTMDGNHAQGAGEALAPGRVSGTGARLPPALPGARHAAALRPDACTSAAAKRVPATWKARRVQTTTWPTPRASRASPALPSGRMARAPATGAAPPPSPVRRAPRRARWRAGSAEHEPHARARPPAGWLEVVAEEQHPSHLERQPPQREGQRRPRRGGARSRRRRGVPKIQVSPGMVKTVRTPRPAAARRAPTGTSTATAEEQQEPEEEPRVAADEPPGLARGTRRAGTGRPRTLARPRLPPGRSAARRGAGAARRWRRSAALANSGPRPSSSSIEMSGLPTAQRRVTEGGDTGAASSGQPSGRRRSSSPQRRIGDRAPLAEAHAGGHRARRFTAATPRRRRAAVRRRGTTRSAPSAGPGRASSERASLTGVGVHRGRAAGWTSAAGHPSAGQRSLGGDAASRGLPPGRARRRCVPS